MLLVFASFLALTAHLFSTFPAFLSTLSTFAIFVFSTFSFTAGHTTACERDGSDRTHRLQNSPTRVLIRHIDSYGENARKGTGRDDANHGTGLKGAARSRPKGVVVWPGNYSRRTK